MATTTNYGWTTPDDTALVKDGASAIRTLGTSVDTTTKALNPSTTLGDIEYRSSTANTNTRLGIGTTGQVLAVSGGVPAWTTPSSGGMTLISETVASGLSSLSLTGLGSYKQLVLTWSGITHSTTGSQFDLRLNNDSGSNYAMMYMRLVDGASNNSATATGTSLVSPNTEHALFGDANSTAGDQRGGAGTIIIDNYTSTSKYKTIQGDWGSGKGTSFYQIPQYLGIYKSASAITSLDIVRLAGSATFSNNTNTTIRLYGVA